MECVLFSSGFLPEALVAARKRWQVLDIPNQREALRQLLAMPEPPLAACIGHVDNEALAEGDDLDARQMLDAIRRARPEVPVVISTHQRDPRAIVSLVRLGAFNYVVEPEPKAGPAARRLYVEGLLHALDLAVQWRRAVDENQRLRDALADGRDAGPALVGRSGAMRTVAGLIRKVAPTRATVLINGESGTGKELVARAIHNASRQRSRAFLALNCGAFPESLIASELFGHRKGAFTGAGSDRDGLIREVGDGTLFLDEIASTSPAFQTMLLRVLEQRQGRPLGGAEDYPVHCRFIAASNQNLEELAHAGRFREDLFYRLNVFAIDLPPLRDRREDIPALVDHFMRLAAAAHDKEVRGISAPAMELLLKAAWPGNVRELRNAVERAVIFCEGTELDVADFDARTRGVETVKESCRGGPAAYAGAMADFERQLLRGALARAGGNQSLAARNLRMNRNRLLYRLQRLGLAGPGDSTAG
jgi:DNA-binding NtrC family response regulator